MDFVYNVGPAALINMIVLHVIFDLIWGRHLVASDEARKHLINFNPYESLTDIPLLYKSLITMSLVLFGFIMGHGYGLEPGTVALTGAAFLLLLQIYKLKPEHQSHKVQEGFQEVEWETIFFFMGLFILVYGVEHTGLLGMIAQEMLSLTGGDMMTTAMMILWTSAILSAIVDNIPFVATMIPMIESMAPQMGGKEAIEPLWWALSLGACLGGNGSLIGASANVMVASFAERAGQRIAFMKFMVLAFPLMLVTIAISTVYVWFAFF
jgi:Na+/H+ antiporter NhaD/arsenite permease-like protein